MSATALKSTNRRFSSLNYQNFEFFCLVPRSPTHTGLICEKTLKPNISSLGPFKDVASSTVHEVTASTVNVTAFGWFLAASAVHIRASAVRDVWRTHKWLSLLIFEQFLPCTKWALPYLKRPQLWNLTAFAVHYLSPPRLYMWLTLLYIWRPPLKNEMYMWRFLLHIWRSLLFWQPLLYMRRSLI